MIAVDGYSDIERIGQGGLGDVYRARRDSTGATVAIKVLRDVSDQSTAWHRTRRELTALVSLAGHANVVQLIEVLDLPEGPALVMEHAPGGSIAELLARRDEPLSVGETVLVGKQTAAALMAAHARGIVHRDVKPQNLLIDAYGQVKLCDFGIAAIARTDEFRARTSAISMRYASPEDLEESEQVGPASDVYSLGATMLHLARGAPPTLKERLAPWDPPATDDPELAALDLVVAACLHPSPSERPTASDVADELERLAWSVDERNRPVPGVAGRATVSDDPTLVRRDGPVAGSDAAPRAPERPSTPTSGRRWPRVAAVSAGAGALAIAVWIAGGDGDDADGDDSDVAVSVVARPEGLDPLTDVELPAGPVGECLVQGDVGLEAVDCGRPHDLQRIDAGTLAGTDADAAFDRDDVRSVVSASCRAAVAAIDGLPDDVAVPFATPSAATWADGDRAYDCFVAVDGRRLVGSVVDG